MGSLPRRHLLLAVSTLTAFLLTYGLIYYLSLLRHTVWPEIYLTRIALILTAFFFTIILSWLSARLPGGLSFAVFSSTAVVLAGTVAKTSVFVWFLIEYAALCFLLLREDLDYENQLAGILVDREKLQNEKNDIEVSYKSKGEGISIFFEKYSTYYNLRKLAEELAGTLSLSQAAQIVIDKTTEFIPRGHMALIMICDKDSQKFTPLTHKAVKHSQSKFPHEGDPFDQWAMRNRKRIIINDTYEDFRFDVREAVKTDNVRSLILAPLLQEGRVIGTLRINSQESHSFTNDDLRILDSIAVLGSSAISNSMLYEQTKELSIRDSLTGLYVRRYFFERLKEEHKRALITQRPLSLVMIDLDHFKECNDRFGHGVGDLILSHFAQILKKFSHNAVIARYGGEEFAVLFPEQSKQQAAQAAETIRENVHASPLVIRRENIGLTVSLGVASIPEDSLDYESLVQKADQALYTAKRLGRNRVCLSKP